MKYRQIAMAATLALALVCVSSFAADAVPADSSTGLARKARDLIKSDFAKADKDNDGTLDRAEATALPDVAAHFDAIDTDRDGTVSKDEIQTYEKFTKRDKDANGTLDRAEAKGWWTVSRNFDAIDTDNDGTVSLMEINAYMSAKKSHSAYAK